MLSRGNLHFINIAKDSSNIKDSYKFFYGALNEDKKNIYAANGLGMVCAEKTELDAAKEIFSRVRILRI